MNWNNCQSRSRAVSELAAIPSLKWDVNGCCFLPAGGGRNKTAYRKHPWQNREEKRRLHKAMEESEAVHCVWRQVFSSLFLALRSRCLGVDKVVCGESLVCIQNYTMPAYLIPFAIPVSGVFAYTTNYDFPPKIALQPSAENYTISQLPNIWNSAHMVLFLFFASIYPRLHSELVTFNLLTSFYHYYLFLLYFLNYTQNLWHFYFYPYSLLSNFLWFSS